MFTFIFVPLILNYMSNNNYYAPIIIFSYKRLNSLKKLIKSIKSNKDYQLHKFYIFSDSFKKKNDKKYVNRVRLFCKKINFKNKKIIFRKKNLGLAKNIISGVSQVIKIHGCAIVLEDDLIVGKSFLQFMNNSLNKYKNKKKVWHITGWSHNLNVLNKKEQVYFNKHMICWGWATWADRWRNFEKNPHKIINNWKKKQIDEFDQYGVYNNWSQIIRNKKKIINTWAVFWNAIIFNHKGLCLNPTKSLVVNSGFDSYSTNISMKKVNWLFKSQKIFHFKIINYPNTIKENLIMKKYLKKKFSTNPYTKIIKNILRFRIKRFS